LKELHKRSLSGILFVIILIGAIFLGPYTYGILFLVLSIFILREFYTLGAQAGYSAQLYPAMTIGAFLFVLTFLLVNGIIGAGSLLSVLPLMFAIPVYELFRNKKKSIGNIALTYFGLIYVSVPFALLNFLVFPGHSHYDHSMLVILLVIIWACDSGAYLIGVRFGRHRLFERISPKKSWEGFFGGLAAAIIATWLLSLIYTEYRFIFLLIIALITVVIGTLGDLVESMMKRQIGVKDSGKFMPGHGGLLDRFDSILMALPFIYFVVQLFANFH